jgi:hypothetical protein
VDAVTYRVIVTPKARIELYNDAIWWAENRSADQAARWLDGFEQAIDSLAKDAAKYPLARENDEFAIELRQMPYGVGKRPTHRAVFEIHGREVIVHGIRHLARRDLTPEDFDV